MSDIDYADLPVNEDGTHVATKSPAGVPWGCPIGYLDHALADGYTIDRGETAEVDEPATPETTLPAVVTGKPGKGTPTTDPTGDPAGANA